MKWLLLKFNIQWLTGHSLQRKISNSNSDSQDTFSLTTWIQSNKVQHSSRASRWYSKTFGVAVERPENYSADDELFKIAYNEKINRVYYDAHYQTKVQLSDECAEALGFVKSSLTGRNQYARYAPDITRGRHSLFVYCNVVDSQIVGDVYVLLRTVAIRGERGSIVTETYDRLHYVPVNTKELSTLEFSIRDDAGNHIKFDSGKIICKLHFRPKDMSLIAF